MLDRYKTENTVNDMKNTLHKTNGLKPERAGALNKSPGQEYKDVYLNSNGQGGQGILTLYKEPKYIKI